jgi:hypothetical protein
MGGDFDFRRYKNCYVRVNINRVNYTILVNGPEISNETPGMAVFG